MHHFGAPVLIKKQICVDFSLPTSHSFLSMPTFLHHMEMHSRLLLHVKLRRFANTSDLGMQSVDHPKWRRFSNTSDVGMQSVDHPFQKQVKNCCSLSRREVLLPARAHHPSIHPSSRSSQICTDRSWCAKD
jgi:hypothetical protein